MDFDVLTCHTIQKESEMIQWYHIVSLIIFIFQTKNDSFRTVHETRDIIIKYYYIHEITRYVHMYNVKIQTEKDMFFSETKKSVLSHYFWSGSMKGRNYYMNFVFFGSFCYTEISLMGDLWVKRWNLVLITG